MAGPLSPPPPPPPAAAAAAAAASPLFTVPIAPQGSIVCTQPAPKIYLLTFQSPPDNRLTPAFNAAFLLALEIIEVQYPRGAVVTTSAIPKFYSNGLDLDVVGKTPYFFKKSMYPLWRKLVTYPMPTIALINGHAFAGGLIMAFMHDYRIMNPHKGFLCMNEVDFGAPLPPPMAGVFRQKLRPDTYRNLILEARRFNALAALKEGLVDGLGGWPETLTYIQEMKIAGKGDSGIYGRLKEEMWRETVAFLDRGGDVEDEDMQTRFNHTEELTQKGHTHVAEFLRTKSKL